MFFQFFNFSSEILKIIRNYFRVSFRQFMVTTPPSGKPLRSASCWGVWFHNFFSFCPWNILRGRAKVTMNKKEMVLPPSRAFMDVITILVPSKVGALLQSYCKSFTWARREVKPKKYRSLSLLIGLFRRCHFCIGDGMIMTVKEKTVKSLERLYEIPVTERHRGKKVQKVKLDGLVSINRTHFSRQTDSLALTTWFCCQVSKAMALVWYYSVLHSADTAAVAWSSPLLLQD